MDSTTSFSGFMVFTKPKNCILCEPINGPVMKLYKKFPDYVRVVDCTNPETIVTCLTQYKIDKNDLPVILQFKNGIEKRYYGLMDYESLEHFLLSQLLKTEKPKTSSDKAAAAFDNLL